jgi:hypothetical protein
MQKFTLNNQIDIALEKIRAILIKKNSYRFVWLVKKAVTVAKTEPFYLRWQNQNPEDTVYKVYKELLELSPQIFGEIRNVVFLAKKEDRKTLVSFFYQIMLVCDTSFKPTTPSITDYLLVDSEPSKKPIKFADDYYNDLANNLDNIKRFGLICGDISRLPTDTQIKLLRRFGKTEREIEALLKQQE